MESLEVPSPLVLAGEISAWVIWRAAGAQSCPKPDEVLHLTEILGLPALCPKPTSCHSAFSGSPPAYC